MVVNKIKPKHAVKYSAIRATNKLCATPDNIKDSSNINKGMIN